MYSMSCSHSELRMVLAYWSCNYIMCLCTIIPFYHRSLNSDRCESAVWHVSVHFCCRLIGIKEKGLFAKQRGWLSQDLGLITRLRKEISIQLKEISIQLKELEKYDIFSQIVVILLLKCVHQLSVNLYKL